MAILPYMPAIVLALGVAAGIGLGLIGPAPAMTVPGHAGLIGATLRQDGVMDPPEDGGSERG